MSREAMEAVQLHSRYQSPEDYYLFRVLLSIASFADVYGVAGKEGKHTECPSYRGIAERARVHRNIIGDKIAELIKGGELEIVKRGGAGRGSWTVYRVNLPIEQSVSDVSIHERTSHDTGERADNKLVTIVSELSQRVEEMAHELSHVSELLSHGNGTYGTRPQRERVTDTTETPENNEKPIDTEAAINNLITYFEQTTGFAPPHDQSPDWQTDWATPLSAILRRAKGDLDMARQLVDKAVRIHRGENEQGKTYTIRNPSSILTAALNIPDGSPKNQAWHNGKSNGEFWS